MPSPLGALSPRDGEVDRGRLEGAGAEARQQTVPGIAMSVINRLRVQQEPNGCPLPERLPGRLPRTKVYLYDGRGLERIPGCSAGSLS